MRQTTARVLDASSKVYACPWSLLSDLPIPHSECAMMQRPRLRLGRMCFACIYPRQVGERDYRIFVENLNNVEDTLAVDILTSVVSETHREGVRIETEKGLVLEGGSVLQFDKCYTGIPMSRKLRVKNTTVQAMDISLSSDRPGEVRGCLRAPLNRGHATLRVVAS